MFQNSGHMKDNFSFLLKSLYFRNKKKKKKDLEGKEQRRAKLWT